MTDNDGAKSIMGRRKGAPLRKRPEENDRSCVNIRCVHIAAESSQRWLRQRGCSTSNPVNTEISDSVKCLLFLYVNSLQSHSAFFRACH